MIQPRTCQRNYAITGCPGTTDKAYTPGSAPGQDIAIAHFASRNLLAVPGASQLIDLINFDLSVPAASGSLVSPDASAQDWALWYDPNTDTLSCLRAHNDGTSPAIDVFSHSGARISTVAMPVGVTDVIYGVFAYSTSPARVLLTQYGGAFDYRIITINPTTWTISKAVLLGGGIQPSDLAWCPVDGLIYLVSNLSLYGLRVSDLSVINTIPIYAGQNAVPTTAAWCSSTNRLWVGVYNYTGSPPRRDILVINPVGNVIESHLTLPGSLDTCEYNFLRYNATLDLMVLPVEQNNVVYYINPHTFTFTCATTRGAFNGINYPAFRASDGATYIQDYSGSQLIHQL